MNAILFLGTSLVSAQYIRQAVEKLGFYPIFLLKISEYSGNPKRAIKTCEYYETDIHSIDDINRTIQQYCLMKKVVAITSFLDETLQNACIIAEKYKIAGPDSALIKLTDKTSVQRIIPEFCPPSLLFNLSDLSEKQINFFINQHENDDEFMLKPGISSGAVGVSVLNSNVSAAKIKQFIYESEIKNAKYQHWLIQPRIMGHLHSLEGYVHNHEILFLGVSRRTRKELTESTNEFPVDVKLLPSTLQKCQKAVVALVKRSNYANGYFHCEFIIDSNSGAAYFIDGNMGRIAGGAIAQQIAFIYGKHPIDVIAHVIDLGLFQGQYSQDFHYQNKSDETTLSIDYCLKDPATVFGVTLPPVMSSLHTQIVDDGKTMPGAGMSDNAWIGFLAGPKKKVLMEIDQLMINTDKGPVRPFYTLFEKQPSGVK